MTGDARANRQLKQRLDSLKAAGVEFLPVAHCVEASGGRQPPVVAQQQGADAPRSPDITTPADGSLFTETRAALADPAARRQSLAQLAQEVAGCQRCSQLYSTRTQTVFGVGPIDTELCFVGEAPGADEDRIGEPFVGAAGQLLNRIISACKLTRDEVYICNTIKCRPPNNREPSPDEKSNCRGFFDRQLDLVKPKFICCLGGVAAKWVLNTPVGITKLRGKWHSYRGIPVMCTYHPAYLLRQTGPAQQQAKAECWEDMKLILARMGRLVPGGK